MRRHLFLRHTITDLKFIGPVEDPKGQPLAEFAASDTDGRNFTRKYGLDIVQDLMISACAIVGRKKLEIIHCDETMGITENATLYERINSVKQEVQDSLRVPARAKEQLGEALKVLSVHLE